MIFLLMLFLMNLIIFLFNYKNLILKLMSIELMSLIMLILTNYYMNNLTNLFLLMIMMLIMMILSSIMGLTILILMLRFWSNKYLMMKMTYQF